MFNEIEAFFGNLTYALECEKDGDHDEALNGLANARTCLDYIRDGFKETGKPELASHYVVEYEAVRMVLA